MDYEKLVKSFGSSLITEDIVARVERVTGRKAHRFLRRGLFFSHRDLTQVSISICGGECKGFVAPFRFGPSVSLFQCVECVSCCWCLGLTLRFGRWPAYKCE